jgi:uncharacterized membrane protein
VAGAAQVLHLIPCYSPSQLGIARTIIAYRKELVMMGSETALWWPLLFMLILVMTMRVVARRRGCGGTWRRDYSNRYYGQPPYMDAPPPPPTVPQGRVTSVDPVEIVRERYARGEIDHEEMDKYLERLLRSDKKRDAGV